MQKRREALMTMALAGLIVEHDQTPAADRFKSYVVPDDRKAFKIIGEAPTRPRWEELVALTIHDISPKKDGEVNEDWVVCRRIADYFLYHLYPDNAHKTTLAATAHLALEFLPHVHIPESKESAQCLEMLHAVAKEFPLTSKAIALKDRMREVCENHGLFKGLPSPFSPKVAPKTRYTKE